MPTFLQFKLSSNRLRSSAEVIKCRRRLLVKEINNKRRSLEQLKGRISVAKTEFRSIVYNLDWVHYQRVIDEKCSTVCSTSSDRLQNKLDRLRVHARSDNGLLDPDSVITNLSSYTLNDIEKTALARGLNFTLPPKQLKKGSYLASYEVLFKRLDSMPFNGSNDDRLYFKNKLRDSAFSSLYNFNNNRLNLSNLPKEELDALKNLTRNEDIIVTKPDKGSGVVIMNLSDYISKVETIIHDETKFKLHKNQDLYKVSRSIETKVRNFLRDKVKKPGHLSDVEYRKLYPNGSHIGVMYGLPKVHKTNNPCRPICSAVGTSTYELSRYVAQIIKPASYNVHGTDLKDTFHFVQQISDINVNDFYMVSFDVQSLFTNVPLDETINICIDRLYRSSLPPPSIPEVVLKRMIELCVKDNVFVFQGKVYYQRDGVAMGNSLGPLLANIFMCHLEETHIHDHDTAPDHYWRYVDDTFCLFKSKEQVTKFHDYLNSLHPSIKFDLEEENDQKLSFLDTVVERTRDQKPSLRTKVKQTDKGLFYNFSSFIPDKYKTSLIFTLVFRIYRIASDLSNFHLDISILKRKLKRNGFPTHVIDLCVGKFLDRYHADNGTNNITLGCPKKEVIISLPFLGPMSYVIKRKLLRLVQKFYPSVDLKIVFRRGYRISSMFSYKDKFPLSCTSGIVYYIQCNKCGHSAAYIGKTINSLYERFYASGTGHLSPNNADSALLEHIMDSGDPECAFKFEDTKILDRGSNDEEIRFTESVLLKYEKQSLNTCKYSIPLQIM